jgi:3-methyladenine DNA glycosylase AlkD
MSTGRRAYPQSTKADVLAELRALANPANVAGMARYGINVDTVNAFGVSAPVLQALARRIGRNHDLAAELWESGLHEGMILASLIDDPALVTVGQMERWVAGFDSWDVCDCTCSKLFDRTPFAWKKAVAWSRRKEEFVKRAGFVLMAALAVHDKRAPDGRFLAFLPSIERQATDERNFVRKAVNWALRQIGKRNRRLNKAAIATARRIRQIDSRAARWIAADAIRELTNPKTRERIWYR